MKRSMDLVRTILLHVEDAQGDVCTEDLRFDGFDRETVSAHVRLLVEAGYLTAIEAGCREGLEFYIERLTWNGYEFLELVRDEPRWRETKSRLKQVGSWAGSVLQTVATELAKQQLGF